MHTASSCYGGIFSFLPAHIQWSVQAVLALQWLSKMHVACWGASPSGIWTQVMVHARVPSVTAETQLWKTVHDTYACSSVYMLLSSSYFGSERWLLQLSSDWC